MGGFQTILFTDIEASTALAERIGDEGAQELLRGHNATVREALDAHRGHQVKHTGDGIMASFPSAVAAVTAAVQIQRELAGGEVRVRVGLNAGEPIAEEGDLFGTSVNLAARVTDHAEPGQVLVTRVVADLCAGKQFDFRSRGDVTLKGFEEAVELFEVAT
jgi:class 3 adenylate cyclase